MKRQRKAILFLSITAIGIFTSIIEANAFTEAEAVRAIMGEARGEPYIGKMAVAEALRRRPSLSGVYGANVGLSELNREKAAVWGDALKAWRESKSSNLVPGCKYWFSDADLKKLKTKKPGWFRKLKFVRKIGGSSFYA